MLAAFVLLSKNDLVEDIMTNFTWWEFDRVGEKIQQKIMKESRIVNTFIVVNSTVALVATVAHAWSIDEDDQIMFSYRLIEEWCPHLISPVLRVVYKMAMFIMASVLTAHSYQVIYTTRHGIFQVYMLNGFLRGLDNDCDTVNEETLMYNKAYQQKIKSRLIFFIKRHNEFNR
jgi:hypothetical protein